MRGVYAGWHLILDCFIEDEAANRLEDVELLMAFLDEVAQKIRAELPASPQFRTTEEAGERKVTAVRISHECHINLHAWPRRRRFSLDVWSNQQFSQDEIQELVWTTFSVVRRSSHWIVRNWP